MTFPFSRPFLYNSCRSYLKYPGLPYYAISKSATNFTRFLHYLPPPTPLKFPHGHHTLLPLVLTCSNLVLPEHSCDTQKHLTVGSRTATGSITAEERVVPLLISHEPHEPPIGWLRPEVAAAISRDHLRHFQRDSASPWEVRYFQDSHEVVQSVSFTDWVNEGGRHARTLHVERMVLEWKRKKVFSDLLQGWNDEAYPVFNHPQAPSSHGEPLAFAIERAALPIFGLPNFGCLLTAYVHDPNTGHTKLWIPRRSKTKKTWPGRLDVTVGGGIRLGDTALATILRESSEEALLDIDYLTAYTLPVGTLPFPNRSPAHWILPGFYYLFELPLPLDGSVIPQINALDGEVESFELMDMDEVLKYLLEGRFKSSSALAVVDFLVRHGFVTEDSDSRYGDVCRYLRTDIGLPIPWRKRF